MVVEECPQSVDPFFDEHAWERTVVGTRAGS